MIVEYLIGVYGLCFIIISVALFYINKLNISKYKFTKLYVASFLFGLGIILGVYSCSIWSEWLSKLFNFGGVYFLFEGFIENNPFKKVKYLRFKIYLFLMPIIFVGYLFNVFVFLIVGIIAYLLVLISVFIKLRRLKAKRFKKTLNFMLLLSTIIFTINIFFTYPYVNKQLTIYDYNLVFFNIIKCVSILFGILLLLLFFIFILRFSILNLFKSKIFSNKEFNRWSSVFLLVLLVFIIFGAFFISIKYRSYMDEHVHHLDSNAKFFKMQYTTYNNQFLSVAQSLSIDPVVVKSVTLPPDKSYLDSFDKYLKKQQKILGTSVLYVLNRSGTTIASSNYESNLSFIGKNYAFRSYFKSAISGKPNIYFARGITSGKRGVYYSSPIIVDSKIVGVFVIKNNIDILTESFHSFDDVFLVSDKGVIFISSDKNLLFKTFYNNVTVSDEHLSQLGINSTSSANFSFIRENILLDKSGNNMIYSVMPVIPKGWKIVLLDSLREVRKQTIINIFFMLFGILTIFILCLFFFYLKIDSLVIKKSDKIYGYLFKNTSDIIIMFNGFGKITQMNPAAQSLFNASNIFDNIYLHSRKRFKRLLRKIFDGGFNDTIKMRLKSKDGKSIFVSGKIHAILSDDGEYSSNIKDQQFISMFQDVSDRYKSLKLQMQKNKELEWLNKLTIGRELKMIELKEQIKKLKNELKTKSKKQGLKHKK